MCLVGPLSQAMQGQISGVVLDELAMQTVWQETFHAEFLRGRKIGWSGVGRPFVVDQLVALFTGHVHPWQSDVAAKMRPQITRKKVEAIDVVDMGEGNVIKVCRLWAPVAIQACRFFGENIFREFTEGEAPVEVLGRDGLFQ